MVSPNNSKLLAPGATMVLRDAECFVLTRGFQVARLPRSSTGMRSFFMLVGTTKTL